MPDPPSNPLADMSEEHKNSMENRLQAAALKRRREAGEPLTLPDVQRRQLQEEAARLYRRPEPATARRPSWTGWLPWLAWATSAAALVTVLSLTLRHNPQPSNRIHTEAELSAPARNLPDPSSPELTTPLPIDTTVRPVPSLSLADAEKQAPIAAKTEPVPLTAANSTPGPMGSTASQNSKQTQSLLSEKNGSLAQNQRSEAPSSVQVASQNQPATVQNQTPQLAARYGQRSANQSAPALAAAPQENQTRTALSQDRIAGRLSRSANAGQDAAFPTGNSASQLPERAAPPWPAQNAAPSRAVSEPAPVQSSSITTSAPADAGAVALNESARKDSVRMTAPDALAPAKSKRTPNASPGVHFNRMNARPQLRQNLLSPPNTKILSSFDLVQDGRRLRVVDYDGSIYDGTWVAQDSPSPTVSTHAFKLSGVNRTTGQAVELSGVLHVSTKNARSPAPPRSASRESEQAPFSLLQAARDWSLKLEGRATLGGSNRFDWTATPGARR